MTCNARKDEQYIGVYRGNGKENGHQHILIGYILRVMSYNKQSVG